MSCKDKECHAALVELESLGFDEWTAQHTAALRHVVETCPACNREWGFFQQSILIVSTTSQLLPSPDQTRLMWQACSTHILHPTERGLEPRLLAHNLDEKTVVPLADAPFWKSWFAPQPALGWAALGAASVVLASVWLLTPEPSAPDNVVASALPAMQNTNDMETVRVAYQRPPAMASALVNNHAMMGPGPFSNYVGSSLISYSAVSPPTHP